MTDAARLAYETLTRESLTRAYVPASCVGGTPVLGELARLGLIATALRSGVLHVIRVRSSHSLEAGA